MSELENGLFAGLFVVMVCAFILWYLNIEANARTRMIIRKSSSYERQLEEEIKHLFVMLGEKEIELDRRQAKIDGLMLEFCPEEMTQEQRANWSANQKRYSGPSGETVNTAALEAAARKSLSVRNRPWAPI